MTEEYVLTFQEPVPYELVTTPSPTVTVVTEPQEQGLLLVTTAGIPGPPGPEGPPGPAGPPGPTGSGTGYTHTQITPSTVWDIEHGLGYQPGGVRVESATGDIYWPQVVHLSPTTVRLYLSESVNGTAYIS